MSVVEDVWHWLLSPVIATILFGGAVYFFRDGILRFTSEKLSLATQKELQSRQHQFEEKANEVKRGFERIQSTQERVLTSLLEISSERAKAFSGREMEAAEAIWASVGRCHVNHRVTSLWAPTPEIMQRSSLAATVSSRRRGIGGVFGGRPDGVGR